VSLGASRSRWDSLGALEAIGSLWELLGSFGNVWEPPGTRWKLSGASLEICEADQVQITKTCKKDLPEGSPHEGSEEGQK
jgi:hypothetical protein